MLHFYSFLVVDIHILSFFFFCFLPLEERCAGCADEEVVVILPKRISQNDLSKGAVRLQEVQACSRSVAQLCLILCNYMGHSLPDSSDYGIFQARILEWVAISLSHFTDTVFSQN